MLTEPDYLAKKIVLVYANDGERISFKNDNICVTNQAGEVKLQYTCYKLFAVFIVGRISLTSGIIERSKRFGFSLVLFSSSFKLYQSIGNKMEGNTLLRKKQYENDRSMGIAKKIVINKVTNQREMLATIRDKSDELKEGLAILDDCLSGLDLGNSGIAQFMGFEGVAAKAYFSRIFMEHDWNGRQPRVKKDGINFLLDVGYTVLFNYMEALLNLYGFDIYKGCLHQEFYKRKSLVCDMVEPFRPIVDYQVRKMFALKQIKPDDFQCHNGVYTLNWDDSYTFIKVILDVISEYRRCIFGFVQSYYRWFMKGSDLGAFPMARLVKNDLH